MLAEIVAEERWDDFGRLIDERFFALLFTDPDSLSAVFNVVPHRWLTKNPRHLLAQAVSDSGRLPIPMIDDETLSIFSAWVAQQSPPMTRDTLAIMQIRMRYLLIAGRAEEASSQAELMEKTIAEATETQGFRDVLPIVWTGIGVAHLGGGHPLRAAAAFGSAMRWSDTVGGHPVGSYASDCLALAMALVDDFATAEANLRPASGERRAPLGTFLAHRETVGILARALIAIGTCDQEQFRSLEPMLADGVSTSEWWWLEEHIRARTELMWGDRERGIQRLSTTLITRKTFLSPGSMAGQLLRSDLSDLYQAQGDLAAAARAIQDAGSIRLQPAVVRSRARLDLLRRRPYGALAHLRATEQDHTPGPASLLLHANAEHLAGSSFAARQYLERARGAIERQRAFTALTEVHHDLPLRFDNIQVEPAYHHRIDQDDALSGREREVLSALKQHSSIRDLAAELHISPNTVKSHLRSLYRKLEVHNRDAALDVAARRSEALHPPVGGR